MNSIKRELVIACRAVLIALLFVAPVARAAEKVLVEAGKFISHAGWFKGGLALAPLIWRDGLDKAGSSL